MKQEIRTLASIAMSFAWHSEKNVEKSDKNVRELLRDTGYSNKGVTFAGIYSMTMRPYQKYFK